MNLLQKLFEGSQKSSLANEDRISTAIEGQLGANWISFANLYTQIKNGIIALFGNKSVLDELGDAGGELTYNGNVVSNSLASGESNEVQFRNTVTGALDSDPLFKYYKTTGVLIAGKSFKDIPSFTSIAAGFEAGKSLLSAATGNTFFGYAAGTSNTTGRTNTFIGYNTGVSNQAGEDHTCVGARAGEGISGSSVSNTIIGTLAAYLYTTQSYIIAIGRGIDKTVKSSYDFIAGVNS